MEWLSYMVPTETPTGPGVYQIFLDGELVYIGIAQSLRSRLCTHGFTRTGLKVFKGMEYSSVEVKFFHLACEDGRKIMERQLILEHQPRFNRLLIAPKVPVQPKKRRVSPRMKPEDSRPYIIEQYLEGVSVEEIAAKLKLHRATVYTILKGA